VIINVSDLRCDALVVTAHGADTVPLPEVTLKNVAAHADAFAAAITTLTIEVATLASQRTARRVIHETLKWLYDTIAEPALSVTPARRVWWCPTRALTQLPFQGAGHHTDSSRRTVLDRTTSSIIPSLSALLRARSPAQYTKSGTSPDRHPPGILQPTATPPKLLITVLPQTPGMPPLADADEEATAVQRETVGMPVTTLRGRQATRDAVRAALASHSFAHFACHGVLDLTEPSRSGICLHDGVLSVSEISGLRLEDAELAVLSACHTAANAAQFADEAIHPAAAFQLAGFRQVIASSWPVSDSAAADLASRLYHELSMPGRLTADTIPDAFRRTIRDLRDRDPRAVTAWAAYLHTGP
jgi:CHAT domain-containing protein